MGVGEYVHMHPGAYVLTLCVVLVSSISLGIGGSVDGRPFGLVC